MILPFTLKPLRKLADEELMARAKNGSDEAFEEIYRRYARRLTGFFVRQLHGDSDTAQDLAHDVFLRAYEARSRFAEGNQLSSWLFTIAYRLCVSRLRHDAVETQFLATLDAEPLISPQPEVDMDKTQLDEALKETLSSLPDHLHLLFSLHYEEELSVPQIADITGIKEGTVKSRLHKTLTLIRQKLKQYETK